MAGWDVYLYSSTRIHCQVLTMSSKGFIFNSFHIFREIIDFSTYSYFEYWYEVLSKLATSPCKIVIDFGIKKEQIVHKKSWTKANWLVNSNTIVSRLRVYIISWALEKVWFTTMAMINTFWTKYLNARTYGYFEISAHPPSSSRKWSNSKVFENF